MLESVQQTVRRSWHERPPSSWGLANDGRRPIPRGRARSRQPAYFFFFAAFFFVAFFFAAFFFAITNHLLESFV
jgi:hypothetical protein